MILRDLLLEQLALELEGMLLILALEGMLLDMKPYMALVLGDITYALLPLDLHTIAKCSKARWYKAKWCKARNYDANFFKFDFPVY
jgi:hypothetical protein